MPVKDMPEEIGWTPDDVAIKRSEVESKIADIVEDESLSVINDMSITDGANAKHSAMMRKMRSDLRVDTTDAEQQSALAQMQFLTWAIIGICVLVSFGGLAMMLLPLTSCKVRIF